MTLIAFEGAKVILRDGALGTGEACCCGGVCDVRSGASGGAGTTETSYLFPTEEHTICLNYEAYSVPDQFIVEACGTEYIDTGSLSGSGCRQFKKPDGCTEVKVTVVGPNGTEWAYSIACCECAPPPSTPCNSCINPCFDYTVYVQGRNVCEPGFIDYGSEGYEQWGTGGSASFGQYQFFWTRYSSDGIQDKQRTVSVGIFCLNGGYQVRAVSDAADFIYFDQNGEMQGGGEKTNVYDDVSVGVYEDGDICCPLDPDLALTFSADNSDVLEELGLEDSPIPEPLAPEVSFIAFACAGGLEENPLP